LNKNNLFSLQTITINELGMHARPAAKIAEMAMEAKGEVHLSNGSSTVNASSIIDILTLCAVKGTRISIQVDFIEDQGIMEKIKAFFDIGFGELSNE